MSGLSLVKSFDPGTYSRKLVLDFSYNPEKNPTDKIYKHQDPDRYDVPYVVHRAWHYTQSKIDELSFVFREKGLHDYHILRSGDRVELRFRTDKDSQLACSLLFPDVTFDLEFLTYPEDVPADYLQKVAARLQEMYDKADPEKMKLVQPVELHADFAAHAVKVRVAGADIPRIKEHAASFGVMLNPS